MNKKVFFGLWTPAQLWVMFIVLTIGLLVNTAAHAATITVTSIADSGPGSLRLAIAEALPGDEIDFDSSLSGAAITLTSGQLVIDKDLTITGLGADNLTISGNNAKDCTNCSRVFKIESGKDVTISGLTITKGVAQDGEGGGISNKGELTLTDCTIGTVDNCKDEFGKRNLDNDALFGGGLFNEGIATLTNCTINCNDAQEGAGILNTGTVTLTDCLIGVEGTNVKVKEDANDAQRGAGISNYGTATLIGCTFAANDAQFGAGLFNDSTGTATLTDCSFSANDGQFGPAISNYGTATLTGCSIEGNAAQFGGGIYNDGKESRATLTDCSINSNEAGFGGGILNGGAFSNGKSILKLKNSSLDSNTPDNCDGTGKFISLGNDNFDSDGSCNLN